MQALTQMRGKIRDGQANAWNKHGKKSLACFRWTTIFRSTIKIESPLTCSSYIFRNSSLDDFLFRQTSFSEIARAFIAKTDLPT